eukprot:5072781-Amphidinium_carterae.1
MEKCFVGVLVVFDSRVFRLFVAQGVMSQIHQFDVQFNKQFDGEIGRWYISNPGIAGMLPTRVLT